MEVLCKDSGLKGEFLGVEWKFSFGVLNIEFNVKPELVFSFWSFEIIFC